MNGDTMAPITVPNQAVQLTLGHFPVGVTSYQFDATGAMTPIVLTPGQSLSLSVGPNVTVLKIQ